MSLTRRRFLLVMAGTACSGVGSGSAEAAKGRVSWQGVSLGAKAQVVIDHADREEAEECLAACRREIERLESLFSLYRADSAIARLNAEGRLDAPEADFLRLLSTTASVHEASRGAFDPTVQPLWKTHARFHSEAVARSAPAPHLEDALASTGFSHVSFNAREIAFAKPGMGLTFNGIAQGYITDRIADVLRARGFDHVLVDIGEIRALGGRSDGTPWQVGIAGGDRVVSLKERALATSATYGTTFDGEGRAGHILNPWTGQPVKERREVTISAPTATLADALSTALCVLPREGASDLLGAFPTARLLGDSA